MNNLEREDMHTLLLLVKLSPQLAVALADDSGLSPFLR